MYAMSASEPAAATPVDPSATLLITGAGSGLGNRLLTTVAGDGRWAVIATARTPERAEELREQIERFGPVVAARMRVVVCDQESLDSVRAAGRDILRLLDGLPPLRSIVLNAGAQFMSTNETSVDGFEKTFAVNVIASHVLVRLLSERLTAPVSVVQIGSGTHYGDLKHSFGLIPGPRWDDPHALAMPREGDGGVGYSTSKLAVVYWTHHLARRAPNGIIPICFDPGMMPGTGLARERSAFQRFGWRYLMPVMRSLPGVSGPRRSARYLFELINDGGPVPLSQARGGYVLVDRAEYSSSESYDTVRERSLAHALDEMTGPNDEEQVASWW